MVIKMHRELITIGPITIYWYSVIIITAIVFIGIFCGIFHAVKGSAEDADVKNNDSSSKTEEVTPKTDESSSVEEKPLYSNVQMTVCVDPGHGGSDGGTTNSDGTRAEKDDNLAISLLVEKYLKSYGVNVIMTRRDDSQFIDLDERCQIANENKADLLVCMHRNSYDGEIRGVEIWVHNNQPKEDTTLAENIMKELESVGISENRGVQYGYVGNPYVNYYINADTVMPSCLVELGFLTDEQDNVLFDNNMDKYAKAVADGIVETGIQLGVVDKDGKRLIEGQLLSEEKNINKNNSESEDGYYADENAQVYNQQESEYEMQEDMQ